MKYKKAKFIIILKILIYIFICSCSWNNPFSTEVVIPSSSASLSSNVNLKNLIISNCTLDQIFSSGITSYTATVSNEISDVTATLTSADSYASIQVRVNAGAWSSVASGTPSGSLGLNVGNNILEIEVTAQDNSKSTYTVTVTRLSNNANLSNLVISNGTLSPGFSSGTTSYTAAVSNSTLGITVTPTSADSYASIQVRINAGTWSSVASGTPSGSLGLNLGYNTIEIRVTAQDSTIKTYTVAVRRDIVAVVTVPNISNFPMGYSGISAPIHTVPFISSFRIGKYEVCYEQWYFIRIWALSNGYTFANAGKEGHDGVVGAAPTGAMNEPVMGVNWRDCIIWCNALSQYEGLTLRYYTNAGMTVPLKISTNNAVNTAPGTEDNPYVNWGANGYRLPSEAEWEASARYINGVVWTPGDFASGAAGPGSDPNATGAVAWHSGNSGGSSQNIGTRLPNQLGIYDMSGNASEWCWDWYGSYTTSSPYTDVNTKGPLSSAGNDRVSRSFLYSNPSTSVISTNRSDFDPSSTWYHGLRVVK